MTKILSFYLFIALLALLAVVLVAAEAEVDPVIQKRLEEAASKEERERKHREGVARAQKKYIEKMMKKHAEDNARAALDAEDDARKDLSPEEIARKKASRNWTFKIMEDTSLKVIPTSSLRYKELKKGDGTGIGPAIPRKMNIEIRGIDGKVYSTQRDYETTANSLKGVPLGDHWEVYVPYEFAYGERGSRGRNIPGYAALIVDIEVTYSDPALNVAHEKTDL